MKTGGAIRAASFSRLEKFESCPLRLKLEAVDKIADEQPRVAADRGTRVHDEAEQYVRGELGALPEELRSFEEEFESLRTHFINGRASLEGEWGFDENWAPVDWFAKEVAVRIKADSVVHLNAKRGVVIDYKTGKKFGNELKHAEQTQLYAVACFLRFGDLEEIVTELWYVDQDDISIHTYTRSRDFAKLLEKFDRRLTRLLTATRFPPKPNIVSCRFCPYHPRKQGNCQYGV